MICFYAIWSTWTSIDHTAPTRYVETVLLITDLRLVQTNAAEMLEELKTTDTKVAAILSVRLIPYLVASDRSFK